MEPQLQLPCTEAMLLVSVFELLDGALNSNLASKSLQSGRVEAFIYA